MPSDLRLVPGTRLGPYEILAPIGAGGMGEVYRARDHKLGRDIAMKVLPVAIVADADRVARFRREAQVLASLNHPNIAQIHGFEDSGPTHALVLELVEGPTLADLLAGRGRSAPAAAGGNGAPRSLNVDDALSIAKQIADALEVAHERGIIHRDLKPANIKVKEDGTVKVLDFGLAKAMDPFVGSPTVADRTMTSPAMTELGVILGTAAYMSPEQAKGRVVDKRSDIWAFGVVLYEMLSGQPLFGGDSVAETIGFVVTREPDWTKLPPSTPASVRRLLARCLTRDPKQRLRDIGEARVALADDGSADAAFLPVAAMREPARRRSRSLVAVLALGVVAGAGAAAWLVRSPAIAIDPSAAHLSILLERGMQLGLPQPSLAISPDGTRLVYSAGVTDPSSPGLWVRPLDQRASTHLAGSTGRNAFFSPDGKWIASITAGTVTKIPVGAGAPLVVCTLASSVWGGTWTTRDEIVMAAPDEGLFRVPASGGTPVRIAEGRFWYPDALPDGRHVIVTADNPAAQSSDDYRIALVNLETGVVKPLLDGGTYVRYVASGHLIYLRARSLMAVAFDLEALDVRGPPVAMVANVHMNPSLPSGAFAVSPTGTLVYAPGVRNSDFDRALTAVAPDGARRTLGTDRRMFSGPPRVSPDGTRLVVTTSAIRSRAWTFDLQTSALASLTPADYDVGRAIWTPDGKQVTLSASRGREPPNIYLISGEARGGGRGSASPSRSGRGNSGALDQERAEPEPQRLTTSTNAQSPASWTQDGRTLVFVETARATGTDLWTLSLDGDRTPRPLLQTPSNEQAAAISPDARHIAYESTTDGRLGVYVADFPSMANARRVSPDTARHPVWSRDGRRLFFRQGGSDTVALMSVDVGTQARSTVSAPRHIVDIPATMGFGFDILSDGSFVMVDGRSVAGGADRLDVVLNWFGELRQKVPGR